MSFPKHWHKSKLINHINILSGYAFQSANFSDIGLIPIARIRDVKRGFSKTYYKGEYDEQYIINDGDLLVGMDGEFNAGIWQGGQALLNQRVCCIRTHQTLDFNFLKFFLPSELKKIEAKTSFVTVKHISIKQIENIQIPLPPLEEQKRIARILDKADEIRRKRKEAIRLTDELLRSTFLDMFGDPVLNPKGWETQTIENITRNEKGSIKRGPFGGALKKEIFIKEGYLVYEQYHALNNDFSFGRYYIDESKFEELKGFEVKPGDIIISCSGVYLGKLAIVPEGAKKGIINQALLKISLDQSKITNHFFTFHFEHKSFRDTFFAANRGSGVPNFPPIQEFKTFPFIVPPISLQNQFELRIKRIQSYQTKMNQSLQESENLFNSLLQRAFKGEL